MSENAAHNKPLALALGLIAACGTTGQPPIEALATKPTSVALGVADVVEVKVFREEELGGVYRVNPDGAIDFPLIGQVRLLGKTPEAIAEVIRARLAEGYLVDPQVSVFVREQNSQKIHVLGQVSKTGTFPFEVGMSVIHAITKAGGFSKLAARNSVSVTRLESGKERRYVVPVGDIGAGKAPNFQLRPGDIIFVPEAIF